MPPKPCRSHGRATLAPKGVADTKAKVLPDRRKATQFTPDAIKKVHKACNSLAGYRQAVHDRAGAADKTAAEAFGRGMPLDKQSAASVADGPQTFLSAAQDRGDLLARAGIAATDLERLRGYAAVLAAITDGKGARSGAISPWRRARRAAPDGARLGSVDLR